MVDESRHQGRIEPRRFLPFLVDGKAHKQQSTAIRQTSASASAGGDGPTAGRPAGFAALPEPDAGGPGGVQHQSRGRLGGLAS